MTFSTRRCIALGSIAIVLMLLTVSGLYLYRTGATRHRPGSPLYEQYVEAFQVGVAALDADLPQEAEKNLSVAVELIPEEPAGWANRGLLYLRTGRLPEAARDLEESARLSDDNPDIQKLLGLLKHARPPSRCDDHFTGARLLAGARQRCVEVIDSGFPKSAAKFGRAFGIASGRVDDPQPVRSPSLHRRVFGRSCTERPDASLLYGVAVRQAQDDNRREPEHGLSRLNGVATQITQSLAAFVPHIEPNDTPPVRQQSFRQGAAHQTQPNDSDNVHILAPTEIGSDASRG